MAHHRDELFRAEPVSRKAITHLKRADAHLARVIERIGPYRFTPREEGSHFDALVRAIVFQQLSGKAAATIHRRLEGLFGGRPPTPAELLATGDDALRGVGLSRQKIGYLRDLAEKVQAGLVPIDTLHELDDDTLMDALVSVRGIGRWTAHMFLMFRLGRPNVLPELDLGVRKGIQRTYGLRKLPTPKDVLRIGLSWSPYASVASWYMWRLLDNGEGQAAPATSTPAKRAAARGGRTVASGKSSQRRAPTRPRR